MAKITVGPMEYLTETVNGLRDPGLLFVSLDREPAPERDDHRVGLDRGVLGHAGLHGAGSVLASTPTSASRRRATSP